MTNLTSGQYRDVIKHVPDATEEIPTIQHLLRRAVETFFKRFGAYPEMGGVAPGKIGIFGDQTQFSDGISLSTASPMATIVVGRKAQGSKFTVVTSADVGKPHKVKFSFSRNRPLAQGCPTWLNHVKGVVNNFTEDEVPPFDAAIESSLPMGVGLGSSAAIEVATYSFLEVLVGKKTKPIAKAKACQRAESFASQETGLVDRIASILAKDRHAMIIDCRTNEVQWVPFRNPDIAFVAVDSHVKNTLVGDEYPERRRHLAKACEILGVDSLRNCTEDDLLELENTVNEILTELEEQEQEKGEVEEETPQREVWTKEDYDLMIKRARFFIREKERIRETVEAWQEGDVESFGEKMKEGHRSLKEGFDFNNPLLDFLVETSLQVEGVLGSRMTGVGLGFGGAIISMMNKKNVEQYCTYITQKFMEYEGQISKDVKDAKMKEKERQREIRKKFHTEHFDPSISSSERIGQVRDYLETGGEMKKASPKRLSLEEDKSCVEKKIVPCIVKVEKPKGCCGTWARYQKEKDKEEYLRKKSVEEEEEGKRSLASPTHSKDSHESSLTSSAVSNVSGVQLKRPTFYLTTPFAGARMLFVTRTDLLRSMFASPLPDPKAIARDGLEVFNTNYGHKPEAVGFAPGTVTLFGEFMEFHLGYIICMALPMYTVTVGGRNDGVYFSVTTLSKEVEEPTDMKYPVPCVRNVEMEDRGWANYVLGTVSEFKGHVPGFSAVINASVPIQIGVNSCAALQASIYTFLENLTRHCTMDVFEKADRCAKSEYEFLPTPSDLVSRCSSIKFFPTFLCKEGHLMFINCKRYKISQYFFDHPAYVFLIGHCKENTTDVTIESLDKKLKQCMEAMDILGRKSLLNADLKHLRCLRKRDASEEVIKRAKYVITEHERTIEAVRAIRDEDYARVGLLMNQSHTSLRDDYEVSSPQIEALIELALSVEGVLGAKMLGKGIIASVIILIKITEVDKCIRYIKKNYTPKKNKPVFYVTKPSRGAFMMTPGEVARIP